MRCGTAGFDMLLAGFLSASPFAGGGGGDSGAAVHGTSLRPAEGPLGQVSLGSCESLRCGTNTALAGAAGSTRSTRAVSCFQL